MGYSVRTAVADDIDNSITACAQNIRLVADTHHAVPAIGILRDRIGMSDVELHDEMRPGTRIPLEDRSAAGPDSFGRRLKTASFSQYRGFAVVTRKDPAFSNAVRDLDTLAASGRWVVGIADSPSRVGWSERIDAPSMLEVRNKLGQLLSADEQTLETRGAESQSHVA